MPHGYAEIQEASEDRAEVTAMELSRERCHIHPEYNADSKPTNGCAKCWAVWVFRDAERYSRMEYAGFRVKTT